MKAAVLHVPEAIGKRPLAISEIPKPQIKSDQVLLRVRACGVCRTDLHIVMGDLATQRNPLVPGHQIVGDIVDGATAEFPIGMRVGVSWLGGVDGTCPYCRRGLENLCDSPTFTGYSVDGGFAEFALARADFVFPLPDDLDDLHAAPYCARALSDFEVCALPVWNTETASDFLVLARQLTWLFPYCGPGAARSMFRLADLRTVNWQLH